MKKRAIFFDAGETLVFRNPSLLTIFFRALRKNNININKRKLAKILNFCAEKMRPIVEKGNVPDSKKWSLYILMVFKSLNIQDKKFMEDLKEKLKKGTSFRPFQDVKEVLLSLKKSGFKIGVVSNASETLNDILKRAGIYGFFDCIIISEIVGYEKPDFMIFKKALEMLRVSEKESIFIGDNFITDVNGAINAGITPVWLHRKSKNNEFSYKGRQDKNVLKIKKLSEIIKLIKKEGWN